MASEQARRENVTDERKVEVEKDRVPKMTTHFESLAGKTREDQQDVHGERVVHQFETVPVRVVGVKEEEISGSARKEAGKEKKTGSHQMHTGERGEKQQHQHQQSGGGRQDPLLEDISNLKATAQHNSTEAIRDTEERYHKAKESQTAGSHQHASGGALEKDYAAQKAPVAKDVSSTKGGALMKDTAMGKVQQTKDYTAQKAPEAKDVLSTKGGAFKDTAMEKRQQAKEYMAQKVPEVKDVLSSKGQPAAEKAKAAKETTVDSSNIAADVGQKTASAKDVTVESGKGLAGYAGKVASGVKDQTVVAGWGATYYTLEKVAEATKAATILTSSVAGYAGEKLAVAKDAVVATEEKAVDYAARKKVEGKNLSHEQRDESLGSKQQHGAGEQGESPSEKVEYLQGAEDRGQKQQKGRAEEGEQKPKQASSGTRTVFQAIGETIVEIGQTTKDLLVGHEYPVQVVEKKENEEPYTGACI